MIWLSKSFPQKGILKIPVSGGILNQINNYPYYCEGFKVQDIERVLREMFDSSIIRMDSQTSILGIQNITWQQVGNTNNTAYNMYHTAFGTVNIMPDSAMDAPQTHLYYEAA